MRIGYKEVQAQINRLGMFGPVKLSFRKAVWQAQSTSIISPAFLLILIGVFEVVANSL